MGLGAGLIPIKGWSLWVSPHLMKMYTTAICRVSFSRFGVEKAMYVCHCKGGKELVTLVCIREHAPADPPRSIDFEF